MAVATSPLGKLLAARTREGELCEKLPDQRVRCVACGHRCLIPPGQVGICKVRFNADGALRVPFGYVSGLQVDPIEKKPFYHALPGLPSAVVRNARLRSTLRVLPELDHARRRCATRAPWPPYEELEPSDLVRLAAATRRADRDLAPTTSR